MRSPHHGSTEADETPGFVSPAQLNMFNTLCSNLDAR